MSQTNRQLTSLVTKQGSVEVWFKESQTPTLAENEVLIEVEGAPINPSDMPVIFAAANLGPDFKVTGAGLDRIYTAPLPPAALTALAARVGAPLLTGLEGCGTVVAAGTAPEAQALLGKRVSTTGPGMFARYRIAPAHACLPLPEGITPAQGASAFINPLTALGMVDTAKRTGHKAMIFTAAASNLGAMVHRLCQQQGIAFIGIVRSDAQVAQLHAQGVEYACNLKSQDFQQQLIAAIDATGARLAYDAIAGGSMVNELLFCMEKSAVKRMKEVTRYGSPEHKQVYTYGSLDTSPMVLTRNFGFSYGIGGWLLFNYLTTLSTAERQALNDKVVDGLTTTFATHYTAAIALEDMLNPEIMSAYMQRGTGLKYLVMPKGPAKL